MNRLRYFPLWDGERYVTVSFLEVAGAIPQILDKRPATVAESAWIAANPAAYEAKLTAFIDWLATYEYLLPARGHVP